MRICMVLEGCYPYVRGGVSSWMHSIILSNPQHQYVLWAICAKEEDKGKFKYDIPNNVAEIHELALDTALNLRVSKGESVRISKTEIVELKHMIMCESPDWKVLFELFNRKKLNPAAFLTSEAFLDILLEVCTANYPHISFGDYYHSMTSMMLPILYILSSDIPKADVYHSAATGYGGMLAALGSWHENKPFILTEHGIYTREREEEILRAKWVSTNFKQHWINLFFMLAKCSYDNATCITALFQRYSDIQVSLGADPSKTKVISNGIRVDQFSAIPEKKPNGYIDIAAVVRLHPIKDIKTMIYSFFELKERVPNARLYILGDTDDEEYAQECHGLVSQLGIEDITFTGNVDVIQFLENVDFTLLTSISEGQPLSVLESLAAGRPCVTTDVGSCKEILEGRSEDQLGKCGICVPPMHPQSIANAMETLCNYKELRAEMAHIGKERITQYYLHDDMIHNYEKNYKEVLQQWQA